MADVADWRHRRDAERYLTARGWSEQDHPMLFRSPNGATTAQVFKVVEDGAVTAIQVRFIRT